MRWVLLAIAVSGCSFPDYTFARDSDVIVDDTASDTSLEDTTPPEDTTPVEMDTGVMDSSLPDTVKPDTAPPPDTAKPDLGPEVPLSTGCTGVTATFCSDWDKVTSPASDFTFSGVGPTGSISLDVGGGRSSPNAMLSVTSPSSSDDVVVANVTKTFVAPTPGASARVDVWLKVESATYPSTTGGGAFLFKFQTNAGGGDGITFSMDDSGYYVDRIATTYEYYPIATKPKPGVWTHVRMDGRLHTTAGSFTLWIDDMTTPVLTKTGISTLKIDTTMQELIVGLYSQRSSGTFRCRYDDVTFSWK